MLVGAIDSSQQDIVVDNPNNFPSQGPFTIVIEAEQMLVTQTQGKTFIVNRAANGTSAATHANGKQVAPMIVTVVPDQFVQHVDQ